MSQQNTDDAKAAQKNDDAATSLNEIGRDFKKNNEIVLVPEPDGNKLEESSEYKTVGYRWVILLIYCLVAVINQVAQSSLSPVARQISDFYDQPVVIVNTLSLVYMGFYIVFNFPSNIVIDDYGARNGVIVGILFTTVGMIMKCFINQGFYICIIGQMLCAIGQPFIGNVPAKLAATWFGPNERVIAITLTTIAQPIGAALGFKLPNIWIKDDDTSELFKKNILPVLYVQAGMGIIFSIATLLFFKNKPQIPPSLDALKKLDQPGQFKSGLKECMKNTNLIYLMLAFGQVVGVYNTLATCLGLISTGYGYTVKDGSNFGAAFVAGGLIGSIPFCIYCEKTRQFSKAMIFICAAETVIVFFEFLFFKSKIKGLTYFLTFSQGFVSLPVLTVAQDFGAEMTYPINESMSTGLLMCSGQFFGIIYTLISSVLIQDLKADGGTYSFLFLAIAGLLGTIFSCFLKNDLRRAKTDQGTEEKKVNKENEMATIDKDTEKEIVEENQVQNNAIN